MKTFSTPFQAHLDSGTTTMCMCWRLERLDGTIIGFTEHDNDLTFDSVTYEALSAFRPSMIAQSLGLSVDNSEAVGAISSDNFAEQDIVDGVYDGAEFQMILVNWQDVSQRTIALAGTIGEIKRMKTEFNIELRSLVDKLSQVTGRTYSRYCDVDFGSTRCGIDATSATYTGTGAITQVDATGRFFILSGVDTYADDWFTYGKVMMTSGDLNTRVFDIKKHTLVDGVVTIELWRRPSQLPSVADTVSIVAGCDKLFATCRDKFNNAINHQGFYLMPGQDRLAQYVNQGEGGMDGGSLFN